MEILRSFFVLLLFEFAGAALRSILRLPLPGPVLGMALLAVWLLLRSKHPERALDRTADELLGWFGLLFVPAGVGVVANLALLRSAWLPIAIALLGSTLLTLLVTAAVMHLLQRRRSVRVSL